MKSALLPRAERRVGRLRVRAGAEGEARHVSILLADALRTASLPLADQGQMLVVRRLSLGRISSFASAATLALQLELALRAARLSALHFASPAAGNANAVIFPGRGEALVALARLHARGIEPNEWFWSAAVPEWVAVRSRGEQWIALLEAAHLFPEGAVLVAKILGETVRAGVEDELLSALPPGRGAEWLEREGWSWSAAERAMNEEETGGRPSSLPAASPNHREVIDRWERVWGPVSERLVWLATVLAVLENPARAADAGLVTATARRLALARAKIGALKYDAPRRGFGSPEHADPDASASAAAQEGIGNSSEPAGFLSQSSSGPPENDCPDSSTISSTKKEVRNLSQPPGGALSPETNVRPTAASSLEVVEKNETQSLEICPCAHGFTAFAGLFFLVPILERLGFAKFLAANPNLLESGFPSRLLCFAGERVGLLADDPLALALDCPMEDEPVLPQAELPKAAREILAFPAVRTRLDSPLISWTAALRRWSRRYARLGLISLIRRPGGVQVSTTQLDIFLDLATADLRLRRVALDVDPGWVPWLGRVVRFHYLEAP